MPSQPVITRFAPSPTGYLHVGGARTALFAWLLARHHGGKFFLRIEDTDRARSTEQAALQLLEDLRWLGLNWDNPDLMFQSRRLATYDAVIQDLLARGLAYKAYETREELDAQRKAAEKEKRSFTYRRPQLRADELAELEREKRPHVVRFSMPVKDYTFDDCVLGRVDLSATQVQDFVIRKEDGMPTYHFAVVVDDAEMGITHVVRGQEHTLNTFLHIALQDALNYPRPAYAHLPIILNDQDGKKMGKRDRDKKIRVQANNWMKNSKQSPQALASAAGIAEDRISEWLRSDTKQLDIPQQQAVMKVVGLRDADLPEILVHDFRKNGYLPEALLNFVALLGWNPGGDREELAVDELVGLFTLEQVNKSAARFNRDKLLAFNTDACAKAGANKLLAALRDFLSVNPDSALTRATDEQLLAILSMKAGFRTLRQVDESSRFLLMSDDEIEHDRDAIDKVMLKNNRQGAIILKQLHDQLAQSAQWNAGAIETLVNHYCAEQGVALGKAAQPIRVAISGGTVSPPIFQSMEFLGRDHVLKRISRCLALVA
jgi:glutamyl-tRNA synthetase